MFEIDVSDALQHPGRAFSYESDGEPDLDGVRLSSPVHVSATYAAEGDSIRISGTVRTQLAVSCTRCLKDITQDVDEHFEELLSARRLDEDDYTYSRDAKRASLDQMIRDLLLTAMPMQQLCSAECKGLCPTCGADLNNGPCGCNHETADATDDSPFAKLKDLF